MNINILFPMLFLVSTTACSNCQNIKSSYSTSGGSESMTYLNLLKDSKYILKHDAWEPGGYDKKESYVTKGIWSCDNDEITLRISKSTYNAKLHIIGKNPLLIEENTVVIHFDSTRDKVDYNLDNKIFYPVSSLVRERINN